MSYIDIIHLNKSFPDGEGKETNVLEDITFHVEKGELLSIMGDSGSGKSTLLKILGGIQSHSKGRINIDDKLLSNFTEKQMDEYRKKKIGYIFQEYNLLDGLTVKENIILPLTIDHLPAKMIEANYQNLVEKFHIKELETRYPGSLSGGQQQRVAICRAVIKGAEIILADEPTANLDSKNTKIVIDLLKSINKTDKTTVFISTHDANVAKSCNRIIFLDKGTNVAELKNEGNPQTFYDKLVRRVIAM